MRGLFVFSVVLCPTLVVACGARTGLGIDVFADASVLFDSTTEDRADVRLVDAALLDTQAIDSSVFDAAILPDAMPGDAGSPVQGIAIGINDTCVVQSSGVLKCFGFSGGSTATAIAGLDGPVVGVDVGRGVFARIQSDELEVWGHDLFDILGLGADGGIVKSPTPLSSLGFTVAGADSSYTHSCAVLVDGDAACWGINGSGELGDGLVGGRQPFPTPVKGLGGFATAIITGSAFTCALLSGGKVQCWGQNGLGQLGDGTGNDSASPVDVLGMTDAVAIAAGTLHACALRSTGTVLCWGDDEWAQLGDGVIPDGGDNYEFAPVDVVGLSGVTAITAGGFSTCALLTNGTVWCWGNNGLGQLGDGTQKLRASPVSVQGISNAIAIAIGTSKACALLSTGAAKCWGGGNLGNPKAANPSLTPVDVVGLP